VNCRPDGRRLGARVAPAHGGKHLLQIINDILDLSKIEAGKLEVERLTVDPQSLVADMVSIIRVRAQHNGLDVGVEFAGPIPETVQTDPTRLRQIPINLLGNAVKFTERGTVTLRVALDVADAASVEREAGNFDEASRQRL
jgi:signal transduction histidine kinase